MCNITKCCKEVCPEHIKITDNAIIPLKERMVDRFYDGFLVNSGEKGSTGRAGHDPQADKGFGLDGGMNLSSA